MPGWNQTSVDELLADPIIRDVMAADGVTPGELRALLYGVQRTIESYAASHGRPTALARFAKLCRTGRSAARANPPTNRGRPHVRKSPAIADCSTLSTAARDSRFDQMRCNARS